jgi:hypothetical protein
VTSVLSPMTSELPIHEVAAVVVNYNAGAALSECVASLEREGVEASWWWITDQLMTRLSALQRSHARRASSSTRGGTSALGAV